jgi:hypothetical protein
LFLQLEGVEGLKGFLTTNTRKRQSKWATGFGVSGLSISRREMRDEGELVDHLQKGDDS